MTEDLKRLLRANSETEHLEFKEASKQFSILGKSNNRKVNKKSLYGYCVAIGNEGGGKLILGVKDEINRTTGMRDVVGSKAIPNIQKAEEEIYKVLNRKVNIEEIQTDKGNVQIVNIPPHPVGEPFKFYGIYLMRNGENVEEMDSGTLAAIINETRSDFSAQINENATFQDLDIDAVNILKEKWIEKARNKELKTLGHEEVLKKLQLITEKGITNACILLVGKETFIAESIPSSEFFLEWRLTEGKVEYDLREIFRGPYILIQDKIWDFIHRRNTRVPFKEGFFEFDIWSYDEDSIREAFLNAFAHREYQNRTEPIYIRVSPEKVSVKSAGGFLPGVNEDNALEAEGQWRNRRLMEVLGMIGLVERAGIGLDRIYTASISQGKGLPDFEGTNEEQVVINLPAKVKDLNFVYFLQKIQAETQVKIDTVRDFMELEYIRENGKAKDIKRLNVLLRHGIIEKFGRGRGVKYVLAKDFYEFIDNRSEYTRKRWLSKEQQKQVLVNYLEQHGKGRMEDFRKLFEEKLSNKQIFILLDELRKNDGMVVFEGKRRSPTGFWKRVDKSQKE